MSRYRTFGMSAATVAALLVAAAAARAESFTDSSVSAYWGESWTDAASTYHSPDQTVVSVSGGALISSIPTDAVQTAPDNEVVNYVRTGSNLAGAGAYYNGTLLGDLSGRSAVSATFSLNNSTLAAAAPIAGSTLVGETYTGEPAPNEAIRLYFAGPDTYNDAWFSNPAAVLATSMNNGQAATLTVDLDPSQWSNMNGQLGTDVPAAFASALSDVTRLGLAFGSGYFYSDGFGFNTGGTASVQLDSIDTTPAPEPASVALLGLGAVGLLARRRRRA
jgi:hypothetical protein